MPNLLIFFFVIYRTGDKLAVNSGQDGVGSRCALCQVSLPSGMWMGIYRCYDGRVLSVQCSLAHCMSTSYSDLSLFANSVLC